jgi:hypothetical protein
MTGFRQGIEESEIDKLGAELSLRISCSIRYCADVYHKPVFECVHGVAYPLFALQGAALSNDWSHITQRHDNHKGESK